MQKQILLQKCTSETLISVRVVIIQQISLLCSEQVVVIEPRVGEEESKEKKKNKGAD